MAILYRRPDVAQRDETLEEPVDILFIQEDSAVAEMYRLKLELDGYRVTLAEAGDPVEELLNRHEPDIVYIDVRSPGERSVAALRELRSATAARNIPVVILSGTPAETLTRQGIELGRSDYVVRCDATQRSLSSITA